MKRPVMIKLARADVERLIATLHKARETRMPPSEVAALLRVLEQACRRFEEGADPQE